MEDEERLERYRQFVAETEGRDISLQDAERELKVTALYIVSQSWQDNLDDPKSLGAETFLKGESQNLNYTASNGTSHGLLVATQAEREDDFINLEYYNDVRKSLSEVLPNYGFEETFESLGTPFAAVHGAVNELVATVEDALSTIDAATDPETYAKIQRLAEIIEDDPELAKELMLEAAVTLHGEAKISLQRYINKHALYEDQKRIYVGKTAANQDFLNIFNPIKKISGITGITLAAIKALPNNKLGLPNNLDELFSKRPTSFDPMNSEQFAKIQEAFAKQGRTFDSSEDALRFLESRGADGVTFNADTILVRPDASPSAVFEELIHSGQHRSGKYKQWTSEYGNAGATARAEYEAAARLVKNKKAYGISDAEHAINQARVQQFGLQLDNMGVPRD